jgi:hypothetical protein
MNPLRQRRALVGFLTRPEIEALLAAPNRTTWLGRRDHAFLLTAVQTGLRLSEMTGLRHEDVSLGTGAHVRCRGKGRKERCTPLAKPTAAVLKSWMREQGREDSKTLFPSTRGGPLSADGVQHLLARHVAQARKNCASLTPRRQCPCPPEPAKVAEVRLRDLCSTRCHARAKTAVRIFPTSSGDQRPCPIPPRRATGRHRTPPPSGPASLR